MPFGYDERAWTLAKLEMKRLLIACAEMRKTIGYRDLIAQVKALHLEPSSPSFLALLGEIGVEEDVAGRGLLTAIVVPRAGDMEPGPEFFELAFARGRDTSDMAACWADELQRVHATWRSRRSLDDD